MYDAINSRYTYQGTDVLINKLNIKEESLLKEYETKMVSFKLATIQQHVLPSGFDAKRLKWIHQYLFADIYDFAGEYRLENITKDNFKFAEYKYIDENVDQIVRTIHMEKLQKMSKEDLLKYISYLMTELNVLHPFRDGNGRTIREFIREILQELGYQINFQEIDYNEILRVSKLAIVDDTEQIKLLSKTIHKIKTQM